MIIIELMGGLGNQLQQYALYKKLKMAGIDVKMDISWFEEENQQNMEAKRALELAYIQGIQIEACSKEEKEKLLFKNNFFGKIKRKLMPKRMKLFTESGLYHQDLMEGILSHRITDLYTRGYFACEYYYADILPVLRKELSFPLDGCTNKRKLLTITTDMKGRESVSLHLRRGDYLDEANAAMFGNICTTEYYDAAIKLCLDRITRPKFFIFSDDTAYAEGFVLDLKSKYPDILTEVVSINHGAESFYDIYMMSCCRYNICANSTFSFWGARLNAYDNRIMIRPTIHANNQTFDLEKMYTWWKGWTFISPQGDVYGRKTGNA